VAGCRSHSQWTCKIHPSCREPSHSQLMDNHVCGSHFFFLFGYHRNNLQVHLNLLSISCHAVVWWTLKGPPALQRSFGTHECCYWIFRSGTLKAVLVSSPSQFHLQNFNNTLQLHCQCYIGEVFAYYCKTLPGFSWLVGQTGNPLPFWQIFQPLPQCPWIL